MTFPRIIALAAFLVYAFTLSWGVTEASLPIAAKVAGWDWQPMAVRPLLWLFTLPLRLLPASWVLPALNLLVAALAASTLGVLARSVALLPWDFLPNKQSLRKLPPLLAVFVCGLEFSFWQAATSATGEMMDLWLFSVAIWCLLEYRARQELRWLEVGAVVWGLGMAENWMMLLTLPVFALGAMALRGLELLDKNFVRRMALLGAAGFSIYLILPLVNWLNPHSPWTFTESWRATLGPTKGIFSLAFNSFLWWHPLLSVVVVCYFLLPTLPCFVRMKNEGATSTSELDSFQIIVYRLLRMAVLLVCAWMMLDPDIGLRAILRQKLSLSMSLLTFDYLNALGIAFLAGNLLYFSQIIMEDPVWGWVQALNHRMRRLGAVFVGATALVLVTGLICRNLPAIRLANGQPLERFGRLVAHSLPPGDGILAGTDQMKIEVVKAALAHDGKSHSWQVVNLNLLANLKYRAALERESAAGWLAGGADFKMGDLLDLLTSLARTKRIFFLQPHYGQFLFERFQPLPLAAVDELDPCPAGSLDSPLLPASRINDNEEFWNTAWQENMIPLRFLASDIASAKRKLAAFREHLSAARDTDVPMGWREKLCNWLELAPVTSDHLLVLCHWYSASLDDWGVDLQRNGKLSQARSRFEEALELNPDNLAAQVNLRGCTNMLAGKSLGLGAISQAIERFKSLRQLSSIIYDCGDFDEPAIRCILGDACLDAGWVRQAWQEFDRARMLAPGTITPEVGLGQVYSRCNQQGKVWEIISGLRPKTSGHNLALNPKLEIDLALLEARYWMSQTNMAQVDHVLEALLQKHPADPLFAGMALKAYLVFGGASNALRVVEKQVARAPNNVALLNNQAALLIQTKHPASAIPVLTHALALTNIPALRLNRAIAFLQLQDFTQAGNDLNQLEFTAADQFNVEFGLATVAAHQRDTNAAIGHLKLCLRQAPPESLQWQAAQTKLQGLTNPSKR